MLPRDLWRRKQSLGDEWGCAVLKLCSKNKVTDPVCRTQIRYHQCYQLHHTYTHTVGMSVWVSKSVSDVAISADTLVTTSLLLWNEPENSEGTVHPTCFCLFLLVVLEMSSSGKSLHTYRHKYRKWCHYIQKVTNVLFPRKSKFVKFQIGN